MSGAGPAQNDKASTGIKPPKLCVGQLLSRGCFPQSLSVAQFFKDSLERVYNGFPAQDIQPAPVGWHDVMFSSLSLKEGPG